MNGSYKIIVQNSKVRYEFDIRRNITIIKGDSATGKTTLVEMISEFYENGLSSGIELFCKKTCSVLAGRNWKSALETMHEEIIFIDEGNAFVYTTEFAKAVQKSDNYYVIVTREGLANLPYSVEEIYGIRESGKYAALKQTYNELYHIYGETDFHEKIKLEKVEQQRRTTMKKTTVVFDLDGTLLDTLQDLANAVNYALQQQGMPKRTLEEVRQFVGNGVRLLMIRAVPDGESNPLFEETFSLFKEYYGEHCNDNTKPYAGVVELIETLKEKGYAVAIVSNKIDFAVKELNELYFKGLVPVAIGEKEGIRRKPAPDTVYEALKELGKTKEEAVYVGDSDVDLETAKNSGMPCISVLWGFRDKEFLAEHGAERYAETAEDVLQFVEHME